MNSIDFFRADLNARPTPWRALMLCCAVTASGIAAAQLHQQAKSDAARYSSEAQAAIAHLEKLEQALTDSASRQVTSTPQQRQDGVQRRALNAATQALGLHQANELPISQALTALADADTRSLWLTSIHLNHETRTLQLKGEAHSATAVNQWLSGLRDQQSLHAGATASLSIDSETADRVTFALELHPEPRS